MDLEGIISEYELMKGAIDFVYDSSIVPEGVDYDGIFVLRFRYDGLPKDSSYFSYHLDINGHGWDDEIEFGGDDLTFSVDSFDYIYDFIMSLRKFHGRNKYNAAVIRKFVEYLEEHREEKPKYYTVKEMNDIEKLEILS